MKPYRDGDRTLQLLFFNEECLVSASHHLALITSLPFVHTARRSYRLNGPVKTSDHALDASSLVTFAREVVQTLPFRGRRSRNKVSVGEPAEGSLKPIKPLTANRPQARIARLGPRSRSPLGAGGLRRFNRRRSVGAPGLGYTQEYALKLTVVQALPRSV